MVESPLTTPASASSITAPFTVICDTREQDPFAFTGMLTDANQDYKPLVVPTVRRGLPSGDYSILGYEMLIAAERKSASDLFNTLGKGRQRFQRELDRLDTMTHSHPRASAHVVVESEWSAILLAQPLYSRLTPKIVFRSVLAWTVRHPRIHWHFCPGRAFAETLTFRLLEKWWQQNASRMSKQSAANKESKE